LEELRLIGDYNFWRYSMAASRNDLTGDIIANVKGDAALFEEGFERIFGKRERPRYIPPSIPSDDVCTTQMNDVHSPTVESVES
jgi:hypothetical protein